MLSAVDFLETLAHIAGYRNGGDSLNSPHFVMTNVKCLGYFSGQHTSTHWTMFARVNYVMSLMSRNGRCEVQRAVDHQSSALQRYGRHGARCDKPSYWWGHRRDKVRKGASVFARTAWGWIRSDGRPLLSSTCSKSISPVCDHVF